MVEKINTTNDQNAETNVDWLQNGERTNETNLNRPVKQVAEKVNQLIDYVDNSKTDLQSQIDERVSIDMSLSSSIDAEAAARANADSVLQSNIDTEAAARANVDDGLNEKIDAAIQDRINNVNYLGGRIDNEQSARIAGDNSLSSRIQVIENKPSLTATSVPYNPSASYWGTNALPVVTNVQSAIDMLSNAVVAVQYGWFTVDMKGAVQTKRINFPATFGPGGTYNEVVKTVMLTQKTAPSVYSGREDLNIVPMCAVTSFDNSGFYISYFGHSTKRNMGDIQYQYLAIGH